MEPNLKILNFRNLKKLRIFIKNNWKKDHILAKDKSFLIWQYHKKKKISTAAAIFKNKILGIQMYIPQSHFDNRLSNKEIFLTIFRCLETKIPGLPLDLVIE